MQLTSALLILVPILASAQVAFLWPRIALPGDGTGNAFWLLAPEVAVVSIQKVEWAGAEIEITPPKKLVVRLVKVSAVVENVIRGSLKKQPVQFYFFANTLSANGYHTVQGWLEPGKRYIVFLRREGAVLRAKADVSGFSIRIRSGRHARVPNFEPGKVIDVGSAIVSLALTPSANAEAGFAGALSHTYGEVQQFAPRYKTAEILKLLLAHRDPALRAEACLVLSSNYAYRDPCLPELLRAADDKIRQQAARWLRMKPTTIDLLRTLRDDPLSLSISSKVEDLSGDLELFTADREASVREAACDALHRIYPLRRFLACR